ncbi:ATP F0F1 synthase subunit B [Lichenihabitans sp. Uapishka_5]|uniref:F0F1 ATP synthase subunit B family protein n=1 Tax=Lichenihabitans sp. Uapishka_5 TaxID=3037302 RepID=UPI0029E80F7A|nr:ATP F0F1 synthase subunit B [Lichenihabitans sp. Uapishka_5]MDX7949983.1 ATP F0F1 synthase subunit B [Lichenihabitans sp. Uapishka_5]
MHFDAEFWVALGFVVFLILLAYVGVHSRLTTTLDDRSKRVSNELAEAKRLRDEAAAVLDSFKRKAAEAEHEAAAIVAQARLDAEAMAKDAEVRMADFVTRRTKQAEQKIALAETQAAADVRAAAADAAVKAARTVLRDDPQGSGASALLQREIDGLKARVH